MRTYLQWSSFKLIVVNKGKLRYRDADLYYSLSYTDSAGGFECSVMKDGGADQTDFETNFKSLANKPHDIEDADGAGVVRLRAFASTDNMRFRGTGIKGTGTAGQVSNIDYDMTEDRFMNGVELILKNHADDDSVKFQVIDKNNVVGLGAGAVLDEFGTNWQLATDVQRQGPYVMDYPALVYSWASLRIVYTSTGGTDVLVKANLWLHKK